MGGTGDTAELQGARPLCSAGGMRSDGVRLHQALLGF